MKAKFSVTFKVGTKTLAKVEGRELSEAFTGNLTIGDVVDKVPEVEAFLEKLTGYRVHIELAQL